LVERHRSCDAATSKAQLGRVVARAPVGEGGVLLYTVRFVGMLDSPSFFPDPETGRGWTVGTAGKLVLLLGIHDKTDARPTKMHL